MVRIHPAPIPRRNAGVAAKAAVPTSGNLSEDSMANATLNAATQQVRNPGTKKRIDPITTHKVYTEGHLEFFKTVDRYKRQNNRLFPTNGELFDLMISLGYRKVPV